MGICRKHPATAYTRRLSHGTGLPLRRGLPARDLGSRPQTCKVSLVRTPTAGASPLRLLDQASAPVPIRRASLSRSIKTYSTNNLRQVDSPLQLPTPKATRTRQHKGRERRTPPLKCSVSKRRLVSEESSIPALRLPLASRRL